MRELRVDPLLRAAAIAGLFIGCAAVLRPFLTSALSAAVLCSATWPVFIWIRRICRGNSTAAAAVMTVAMAVGVLLPVAWLASTVARNVPTVVAFASSQLEQDVHTPPGWLTGLPFVGGYAGDYWERLAGSREELLQLGRSLIDPIQAVLVQTGLILGQGIAQLALAFFIGFFLFRDGDALVEGLRGGLLRISGEMADELLGIIDGTIKGVMLGIVGTSVAQGSVAALGFAIAGVPGPILLGVATSVLSLIPVGPPLIWGGATMWLFSNGSYGWSIFMGIWGVIGISGVDNVVKPVLISRGASMPFVLVLLGILGGVLAFGFTGVFIGPTLLAVGMALLRHWSGSARRAIREAAPEPSPSSEA